MKKYNWALISSQWVTQHQNYWGEIYIKMLSHVAFRFLGKNASQVTYVKYTYIKWVKYGKLSIFSVTILTYFDKLTLRY